MENKVFIQLYVPELESTYDLYLPISRRIGNIIQLLVKAVNDFGINYELKPNISLYSRETGERYSMNQILYETNIRSGSQLVLL